MIGQTTHYDTGLVIDGEEYVLDEDSSEEPPVKVTTMNTQPGDDEQEFERRLINLGNGWGTSKYSGQSGYDYGDTAVLHRRLSWLPGAKVTDRTPATKPIGAVSFCEYWDGDDDDRRLVIVSPRHIFDVESDGTVTANDLGSNFTVARGMTKGVLYRTGGMTAPKLFIARPSATSTDYFVEGVPGSYAVTSSNKRAFAFGRGIDNTGAPVLWRVTEDQKLNQATTGSDPSDSNSWATATYPNSQYLIGDSSSVVTDIVQQNRSMLAAKPDGIYTFDNNLQVIPVTPGMRATPDARNGMWFKDANGMAVCPTAQGIIWIDGLTYGATGPVSGNPDARNLRGQEVAVSTMCGNYLYCGVWDGTDTWIFMGRPVLQGDTGSASVPFSWHGPVAKVAKQVTDLEISTVWGTKLWIGYADGFSTIDLETDFSPKHDAATGDIFMPEGILDLDGPGVIKDLRKAEFIAPADQPFSSTNKWSVKVDVGSGFVEIDDGPVDSGVYAELFWTTETYGQRPRVKLSYSGNTGDGECEQVIIRGTERPETTDVYQVRIVLSDNQRTPMLKRTHRAAETAQAALRALKDAGRKTSVVYGRDSFTARVVDVSEIITRPRKDGAVDELVQVTLRKVVLS